MNHSDSCGWGHNPYIATQWLVYSANLLITNSPEGPGEAESSLGSLPCLSGLLLRNKDLCQHPPKSHEGQGLPVKLTV